MPAPTAAGELAAFVSRMEAMLLAHQANTEARIADMDSRLAGVEARAPVPATQGALQPSPMRIAPQPVFAQEAQQATPPQVLLQPTQPMQATAQAQPPWQPKQPSNGACRNSAIGEGGARNRVLRIPRKQSRVVIHYAGLL